MNGPVHNLLMQFFTLGSSKFEVSDIYFFDILTPGGGDPSVLDANYPPN